MHLTGLLGMSRRVYTYESGLGWDWLNLLSSVSGFVMAIGVAVILIDLALHFRFGRKSPPNPWQAGSLEWATAMPVSVYNFSSLPAVPERYPLWERPGLAEPIARGEFRLPDIDHGRREILLTDAVTGKVQSVITVPSNSWVPLMMAVALGLLCVSLLVKAYGLAIAAALIALVIALRWSWVNGAHPALAPVDTPDPPELPFHSRTCDGPGRWGMIITLMADSTFFVSLIFGWLYLWAVAPDWQAPAESPLSPGWLLSGGVAITLAAGFFRQGARLLARGQGKGVATAFRFSALLGLLPCLLLVWLGVFSELTPTALAHDSVLVVLLCYLIFHAGLAVILTVLQSWRLARGLVGPGLPYEPQVVWPFWLYTAGIYWLSLASFVLLPMVWGGGK